MNRVVNNYFLQEYIFMIFILKMETDEINNQIRIAIQKWVDENQNQWGGKAAAAGILGISAGHLSNLLNGQRNLSEKLRIKILKRIGIKYEQMIGGIPQEPIPSAKSTPADEKTISASVDNVIELEHTNIIKSFQNKELAKAINQRLLDLERIDPGALDKVIGYLDGMIGGYKVATDKHLDQQEIEAKSRHGDTSK